MKGKISYDSIYMKYLEQGISETGSRLAVSRGWELLLDVYRISIEIDEKVLKIEMMIEQHWKIISDTDCTLKMVKMKNIVIYILPQI